MTVCTLRRSALLLLATALSGCAAVTGGDRGDTTLLALPSLAAAEPATGAIAAGPVLVLRRLELPEYLLARRVRYRAEAQRIGEWPGTFWAERIEVGMTRELAAALRAALPADWTVCDSGCSAREPQLALRVEVAPLDFLRPHRELRATVRTGVQQGGSGPLLQSAERAYRLQAEADTPQAHAAVLGRLLQQVAADARPLLLPQAPR